ncbi:MAG: hypothetical protein HOV81_23155 [Kofleriaceae bacterium]|nr:hypothetical protein [Kofleriaceae bacterium]
MGKPDNSPPARPRSVPAEASWDAKDPSFAWFVGGVDDEGRRHGTYRSWTRDGVLHGECGYDHGKVHGKNINFHPDGTVASEGDWVDGVLMDSVFHRCAVPSPEPFAQAASSVWSVRYYTRDGKTNHAIRYFLRDGTECGPDGNVLPPRPKSVANDARWFPEMERWVDGQIERGTNKQVGRWRWWSPAGVLRHEELRDARGEATLVMQYAETGALEKKTTRSEAGEEREYFGGGKLTSRYRSDAARRETYKGSWLPDGTLDEERTRIYDGDALASVTERGRSGVLVFEARREGPALACLLYRADGKRQAASGLMQDGMLAGTWRIFDDAGAVRRELDVSPLAIRHEPTGEGLRHDLGNALFIVDAPGLPTPAGLAGVDAEPWADTPGCFDEHVEEFPRLLRGLASPDALVRDYCLAAIDCEIEHQSSTYPATARAIPYLARLLSHPAVDRPALLAMIQAAGENSAPYVAEVQHLDADDPERFAIEGTYHAVCAAWPDVFASFAKATPAERRQIFALARLSPSARKSIVDVARRDADPTMRACAIDSLTSHGPYDLAELVPCLGDRDPLVRAATAIAIALTKGPETPREVVATLREAVHGYKEIAARFAELPYTDGHVLAYLALAAGAVRSADARSLAQALCEHLDDVDGRSAVTYARGLVALALGKGERPFAKRFVEILHTLAASRQFWMFDVDAREVLERWNLPRSQAELKKLVGDLEAASDPEATLHGRLRPKV